MSKHYAQHLPEFGTSHMVTEINRLRDEIDELEKKKERFERKIVEIDLEFLDSSLGHGQDQGWSIAEIQRAQAQGNQAILEVTSDTVGRRVVHYGETLLGYFEPEYYVCGEGRQHYTYRLSGPDGNLLLGEPETMARAIGILCRYAALRISRLEPTLKHILAD